MMRMTAPTKSDPRELRVIHALIKEGFSPEEICKLLHFSPATYYRRKAEIDHLKLRAEKLPRDEE